MISNSFNIFDQFRDRVDIRFFTKEDAVGPDAETMQHLETDQFVSLKQIHGDTTVIVRSSNRREKEADGVLTDQENLWLSIRVADCQSFVVYAPEQNVVGLLHAGWKGLVKGIIPHFFEMMTSEWNIDPSTVIVAAGPSLCTECAEFTDPIQELVGIDPQFFHGRNADLRAIADDQLMKCGVKPEHMKRHPDCTKCHPDRYWSYRGGNRDAVIKGATNVLTVKLKMKNE